jgi:hypothetical protein
VGRIVAPAVIAARATPPAPRAPGRLARSASRSRAIRPRHDAVPGRRSRPSFGFRPSSRANSCGRRGSRRWAPSSRLARLIVDATQIGGGEKAHNQQFPRAGFVVHHRAWSLGLSDHQFAPGGPLYFYSALMPAALMIGHHFSISTFGSVPSASGVC